MKIILIDDQVKMGNAFTKIIKALEHEVAYFNSGYAALALPDEDLFQYDAAFIDMNMDGMDGCETGLKLKARVPAIVTIMLTSDTQMGTVIKALRDSQFDDFLCKRNVAKDAMAGSPQLQETILRAQNILATRKALTNEYKLNNALRGNSVEIQKEMVGNSWAVKKLRETINKVAPLDTTVLITGESGTGKELVAREIYKASNRSHAPFVTVNCDAIPHDLLESELFGQLQPKDLSADQHREGFFKMANGGTLLLDELGSLPLGLQAKLAKALREHQIYPVGSSQSITVDVRVIGITNQDLLKKINEGNFREDLFYQLNVFPIAVAPLRERTSDIEELVQHFITTRSRQTVVTSIAPDALKILRRMSWRGNVRQLENIVEQALIECSDTELCCQDFKGNAEFAGLMRGTEQFTEETNKIEPKKIEENKAYLKLLKRGWSRKDLDRAGFPFHPEIETGYAEMTC
ncbi:MAG: sigma-54-dependent Fis family transcriptional regulator [SAR324 cluster bacterium]|nr:sigma-54-dependent Fis family transcriptional regulator [SAR324 cluster bacterium]